MYPYQTYQQPLRQDNNLVRVTGLDGAKAYQMPPNSTVALFDGGEDLMYIKSTDGAGFPTIKTFKFEAVEVQHEAQGEFISRTEFEKYKTEVNSYVEQLIRSIAKPAKSSRKSTEAGDE